MTLEQLATAVQAIGVVFLLVGALYGLHKRWWVPGWQYAAKEQEATFWRDLHLRTIGASEKVVTVAEKVATGEDLPDA